MTNPADAYGKVPMASALRIEPKAVGKNSQLAKNDRGCEAYQGGVRYVNRIFFLWRAVGILTRHEQITSPGRRRSGARSLTDSGPAG